jgi:hypothetical protein
VNVGIMITRMLMHADGTTAPLHGGHSAQISISAFCPTTPIKNSPMAMVLKPTFRPSSVPTYPLTAAPKRFISVRGSLIHPSSRSRCKMSRWIAEPVMPRNCVKALVRTVRHVMISGGDAASEVAGGSKILNDHVSACVLGWGCGAKSDICRLAYAQSCSRTVICSSRGNFCRLAGGCSRAIEVL